MLIIDKLIILKSIRINIKNVIAKNIEDKNRIFVEKLNISFDAREVT